MHVRTPQTVTLALELRFFNTVQLKTSAENMYSFITDLANSDALNDIPIPEKHFNLPILGKSAYVPISEELNHR